MEITEEEGTLDLGLAINTHLVGENGEFGNTEEGPEGPKAWSRDSP